ATWTPRHVIVLQQLRRSVCSARGLLAQGKPPEASVWRVHGHLSTSKQACLVAQLANRLLARLTVDLDRSQHDEVGEPSEARPRHIHVVVQRRRVGVYVDDGHLPAVLAEVDV